MLAFPIFRFKLMSLKAKLKTSSRPILSLCFESVAGIFHPVSVFSKTADIAELLRQNGGNRLRQNQ